MKQHLDLKNSEALTVPGATVYVMTCSPEQCLGFLHLSAASALQKHNRPVEEWLVQIEGVSIVKLFDGDQVVQEVTLRRGDSLKIPANQFHQHTNQEPEAESLTSWHFDGDITEVIEKLRVKG